ncbi:MAG: 16S rRNA (uracil(1498)-N(3))-methyltransferase [Sphaerobacter sp.]|nr:16S rRNA (uracil(1498)-N(3))-methyltransferase [Sphaerobacter sp.]
MAGPTHRFYVPIPLVPGATVDLPEPQSHQIARVLRLGAGDMVVLFNGDGTEVPGTIRASRARCVTLELGAPRPGRPEPQPAVHLAHGLLKADRFDWVVQKATELGVARITPLATSRSVVSLPPDRAQQRRERWQRIAIEAAEQSGRVTVPVVAAPARLDELLPLMAHTPALLCWERESAPLRLAPLPPAGPLLVLVGPEGGFTRDEVDAAVAAGAHTVSLGPLILRSETAAVAALAGIYTLAGAARSGLPVHAEAARS